ncbi:MAG: hypothetical protein ACRDRN_17705 [Sciscionella sp.]
MPREGWRIALDRVVVRSERMLSGLRLRRVRELAATLFAAEAAA